MSQLLTVKLPKDESAALRSFGDAKNIPFSQVFRDYFARYASNPKAIGDLIADRIRNGEKKKESSEVEMVGIYLGRDLYKKFMEISDASMLSRTALATLIIQSIIQQERQVVQQGA